MNRRIVRFKIVAACDSLIYHLLPGLDRSLLASLCPCADLVSNMLAAFSY
jgi:hypothetical protein